MKIKVLKKVIAVFCAATVITAATSTIMTTEARRGNKKQTHLFYEWSSADGLLVPLDDEELDQSITVATQPFPDLTLHRQNAEIFGDALID